jgi:hypothetical protein
MVGPITATILGLIALAILVTVLIKGAQYLGWLDSGLATKIFWGTGVVIVIVLALVILHLILSALNIPIRMP